MALILWSKTLLKTVKDQVSVDKVDEDALLKRIRRKWSSMSQNFQTCWHQAAKGLLDISNVAEALGTHADLRNKKCETKNLSVITNSTPEVVSQRSDHHRQKYHNKRDRKGRWTLKEEKVKVLCDICNVEFPNEWKLNRHKSTKIHTENIAHSMNFENQRGKNEHDEYMTNECVEEREILYESPCDIIMEDQLLTQ